MGYIDGFEDIMAMETGFLQYMIALDVKNEDEVILIGRDGDECITMEEVGGLSGRFNYEFACDLGKRIPRVYIHGGRIIGTRDHFSE